MVASLPATIGVPGATQRLHQDFKYTPYTYLIYQKENLSRAAVITEKGLYPKHSCCIAGTLYTPELGRTGFGAHDFLTSTSLLPVDPGGSKHSFHLVVGSYSKPLCLSAMNVCNIANTTPS